MTDIQVADEIYKLREARRRHMKELMEPYDSEMNEKIKALQDKCSHSHLVMRTNGIGVYFEECSFCGKIVSTTNTNITD